MTFKLTGTAWKVGLLLRRKIKKNNNNKLLKLQSAWQIKMLLILIEEQGLNQGYYVTLVPCLIYCMSSIDFILFDTVRPAN